MARQNRNCKVAHMADDDRSSPPATVPAPHAAGAGDAEARGDASAHPDATVVTRSVEIDAEPAEVWRAVVDPAERSLWLDDPDALSRRVRVDETVPGERQVWTWWHPGDEGGASTVAVVLQPGAGGGTRVVVTESLPVAPIHADARLRAGGPAAARRGPSWLRCTVDRWDGRLLGLELLFVGTRAGLVRAGAA